MKFLLALALTCILSVSTLAGEIPSGGVAATGQIPSGGRASTPTDSTQEEISSTTFTVLLTIIKLLPV